MGGQNRFGAGLTDAALVEELGFRQRNLGARDIGVGTLLRVGKHRFEGRVTRSLRRALQRKLQRGLEAEPATFTDLETIFKSNRLAGLSRDLTFDRLGFTRRRVQREGRAVES